MPSAPAASAAWAFSMAWAVDPPAEARTGTMLPTSSTAARTTRSDSAGVSEKPSPVPPAAKRPGDREAGLPGQVLAVVLLVELQLCIERGDGEGEQAVLEDVRQFLGCVLCHDVVLRVSAVIGAEWCWFPFSLGSGSMPV